MNIYILKLTSTIALATALTALSIEVTAQTKAKGDPSGYITKYNPDFSGIGPQVYFLPPPRTLEEILHDEYRSKKNFSDTIAVALTFQRFLIDYKPTSNVANLQPLLTPTPTSPQEWENLIQQHRNAENLQTLYGLLNEYALNTIKSGSYPKALEQLHEALAIVQRAANQNDLAVIQFNLANLYLFHQKFEEAASFQEQYYKKAVNNKTYLEQANSLVKIATIQAFDRDFKSAEQTIIRRAIPLYNKTRSYEGKILAWEQLAMIYQMQKKHTEAQWFLLQARDLANKKSLPGELAELEYMLAESKFDDGNLKVSKNEFLNARKLAEQEDNKLLQLAVENKIGELYMKLKDYDAAKESLEKYWTLRDLLFK